MQLYNIIFNIFYGGRSPQRQKSYAVLVAQNSVPTQERRPGVPIAESCRPLGGSPGQARADTAYEAKLLGKAARPRPPWLGLQSPYPTPCPMSHPPESPTIAVSSQPRAEEGCVPIPGKAQLPVFLQVDEVRLLLERDMRTRYGPTDPSHADGPRS